MKRRESGNGWSRWLACHWEELHPLWEGVLRKKLGAERYPDEFEDIIHNLVTYLIGLDQDSGGRSFARFLTGTVTSTGGEDSGFNYRRRETLVMWCLRKGLTWRTKMDKGVAQLDDLDFEVVSMDPTPEQCYIARTTETFEELLHRADLLVQKEFKGRAALKTWELLRQGLTQSEVARARGIKIGSVHPQWVQIRRYLEKVGFVDPDKVLFSA